MALFVGMMSGTSLDGVDAVLVKDDANWQVVDHVCIGFSRALRQTLLELNYPSEQCVGGELHRAKVAEHELTRCYAFAYQALVDQSAIDPSTISAIGAHGQTVRHEPNANPAYTLQLLDGALLSELTSQTVVCDFRSKDIAAGGQGAPLAPLFHQQLFDFDVPFAVVNIGGISNISVLGNKPYGFDCGPGNCLMDEWIDLHCQRPFDHNGDWASQGYEMPELLKQLLNDAYFRQHPPKSTGRDYFSLSWLNQYLSGQENPVDVMRTLVMLTAQSIVDVLPSDTAKLVLVGGGAKNNCLVKEIRALLPATVLLHNSSELGVDVQHVESLGFAMLAKSALAKQALDTRAITGAEHPVVLGAVYHA